MPYQGLGFAVILGVGLAAAIFYFLSQAGREPAHSNNNNNNRPPSFDRGPYTNSWHGGSRDTSRNSKPKRKRSMQTEKTECRICFEELKADTIRLPCKHEFHSCCISQWFRTKESPSCPLCRASAVWCSIENSFLFPKLAQVRGLVCAKIVQYVSTFK